jgi:DNA-binding NarL/FixJ family response regulator
MGNVPLRIFLQGRASSELDALRRRLLADSNLEMVDRAELADAIVSLPVRRAEDGDGVLIEALTAREQEVLELVSAGLHNRDIAKALGISEHTVKFHLASLFGKLGASTRTEAVHRGLRHGVIDI